MDLQSFFQENRKVALAFSGGVDSAYLMYAAKSFGAEVKAYYVKSAFQPEFEYQDACQAAGFCGVEMETITIDILDCPEVTANPKDRCYYCKQKIFGAILKQAKRDGFEVLMDGTNASDEVSDRPGMKVLAQLQVRSPLRECGLTKQRIRELSREAGLFTWDKSAYACLATRISAGEQITKDKLERTEQAENYLFSLGFTDFRVRMDRGRAKLQVPEAQLEKVLEKRPEILRELKKYYAEVFLDLEDRG